MVGFARAADDCWWPVCGFAVGLSLLAVPIPGRADQTKLVSVTRSSHEAAGADAFEGIDVSLSANGRYVIFQSDASTIVANDHNNSGDVFVRDLRTLQTQRISVDSRGNEGNRDSYGGFSISADGRYVAFSSLASNLVPDDTNGASDIFVHDRVTGSTERVSVSSRAVQANLDSSRPSISADGRYVAFESAASNLAPGDGNGGRDVFVHDRRTGRTERASIDVSGVKQMLECVHPSLSADGRFVAFVATHEPLGLGRSVWLRDRLSRTTELVSVGADDTRAEQASDWPAVSASGRFVAFESLAGTLVAADHNGASDIFIRDRQTGVTELVSIDSSGRHANAPSGNAAISAQGRFVAFESLASNLVGDDHNGKYDVFVRDRATGRTERISIDSQGAEANGHSFRPSLNTDGRFVAFDSLASDLAANDYNHEYDVYVHSSVRDDLAGDPATFTIKPNTLAFGAQALAAAETQGFWLLNTGATSIRSVEVDLRGTDAAAFAVAHACTSAVAPGAGCRISVTFKPTSVGQKTAVLHVLVNGDVARTRYLTGAGLQATP